VARSGFAPLELVRARGLSLVCDDARLRKPALSSGDTFNVRTGRPERGGILCQRVFGPMDDDVCMCGKYDGAEHRGVTCEKCGVEVTSASVRGEWFGCVALTVPVVHPWFAPEVAGALGVSPADLAEVLPLIDSLGEHASLGEALASRFGDRMLTVLPVLPPDLRPGTWKERDPKKTPEIAAAFRREKLPEWVSRRFDEHRLRAQTHDFVMGGTNRRYVRVIEQNARLRSFRERCAPTPVLLVEESKLFLAIASLLGANAWAGADRRGTPASIAGRLEAAIEACATSGVSGSDGTTDEITRWLLAAGFG